MLPTMACKLSLRSAVAGSYLHGLSRRRWNNRWSTTCRAAKSAKIRHWIIMSKGRGYIWAVKSQHDPHPHLELLSSALSDWTFIFYHHVALLIRITQYYNTLFPIHLVCCSWLEKNYTMLKNWIIVIYFILKLATVDAVSSWRSVSFNIQVAN